MKTKKKCGIYALTFYDKIIYVGQSKDIEKRVKQHLNWKARINEILKKKNQQGLFTFGQIIAYQRYSFIAEHEGEIDYVILQECEPEFLDANEKYWINKYKPKFNYDGVYDEYKGQHRDKFSTVEACAW